MSCLVLAEKQKFITAKLFFIIFYKLEVFIFVKNILITIKYFPLPCG